MCVYIVIILGGSESVATFKNMGSTVLFKYYYYYYLLFVLNMIISKYMFIIYICLCVTLHYIYDKNICAYLCMYIFIIIFELISVFLFFVFLKTPML